MQPSFVAYLLNCGSLFGARLKLACPIEPSSEPRLQFSSLRHANKAEVTMHLFGWEIGGAANPFARPMVRSSARRRPANQRGMFETLENRLVLAVALRPGPAADEVVVTPSANAEEFEVRLGPAIVSNAGNRPLDQTVVDMRTFPSADQRYAIPTEIAGPLFQIDTGERYSLTAAGNPQIGELPRGIFGYRSFDIDRQLIETIHVAKHELAADTTLVSDLTAGDTSFLIANASGWSNEPTESAESRSLAWYGYTDSTGFTYADYSYTRNFASDFNDGLWAPGGIWFDSSVDAYRVLLNEPWEGPAIAAGTAVRNATAGPALSEPFPTSLISSPIRWPQLSATIGGEWENGQYDDFAFRPGTAFIQVGSSVDASIWNNIAFGPEQDFPGAVLTTVVSPGASTIALDLDILAKRVTSFAGDYNQDGAVDAADYVLWRKGLGSTRLVPFSGADGNGDGAVDELDYEKWRGSSGSDISISIDSAAATHGTATIVAGAAGEVIHYESPPWFVGADVIHYSIRDVTTGATYSSHIVIEALGSNFGQDANIVATLESQSQVVEGNDAPRILFDASYSTAQGQTLSAAGLLEPFSDPADEMVVRLLSGPAHGTLSVNYDGTFQYTPLGGFVGIDVFRYEAFDGLNTTSAAAAIEVLSLEELLESRLHDIGIAMLNYREVHDRFPIANDGALFDANGAPFLSWRVHLLPYLGLQSLYDQFRLDEAWNSPHNLPLLDEMPDIFRSANELAGGTTTRMQTFTGPDAPFGNRALGSNQIGPRPSEFRDDAQHTILVVESAPDAAVPWTKPDDLEFDANNPLAALGTTVGEHFQAVMADGATITLPTSIDADTFKALVTIDGDEIVDAHTLRREFYQSNAGLQTPEVFGRDRDEFYFKQLAIAMHAHLDARGRFPVSGSGNFDEQGNPYLSWRVHLLPYLGYRNLYDRFNLDEPWNSANNLPLLAEMPDLFRSADDAAYTATTRVQTFTGPDAPFGYRPAGTDQVGPRNVDIVDGFSNTILFVEAGVAEAVPWTMPEDLAFHENNPLSGIDLSRGIRAAFFDTSQATLRPDIPASDFAALVTRAGGETVSASNFEWSGSGQFKSPLQRQNDLKQIIIAMLNYESARSRFPVNRLDAEGAPLLSWRVMLLPYMEQGNLFDQFHLDEPWDSPHNLSLLEFMPDVYRSIGDPADSVTTRLMHFHGPDAPFPSATDSNQLGPQFHSISDGASRTIAFVEAGPENAAPWTKPVDLPLYPNSPFSVLGQLDEAFLAAFFDGHIETLPTSRSAGDLKARITHQGGEDTTVPNSIVTDPGFFVIHSGGDTKTNEFGVDSFYVVLDRPPTGEVVIGLSVSDDTVSVLDRSQLTFTAETWNIPQQVGLRGVDNLAVNADRTVQVTVSVIDALSAAEYQAVPTQVFAAAIVDDELGPPALPGDYNLDGNVNAADYVIWRRGSITVNQQPYRGADGSGDGRVDQSDYQMWHNNFGAALLPPASTAAGVSAESATTSGGALRADQGAAADDAGQLFISAQSMTPSSWRLPVKSGLPLGALGSMDTQTSIEQSIKHLALGLSRPARADRLFETHWPMVEQLIDSAVVSDLLLLTIERLENENQPETTAPEAIEAAFAEEADGYELNERLTHAFVDLR
jgi:Protein of unknown function (DUF1559)/Bacterial Ig domain/Dockerin type I domain